MSHQSLAGLPQGGDRLFLSYGRKIFQELRQRLPAAEVVEQGPEWDACADEDRRPSENIRVAVNNLGYISHGVASIRYSTRWIEKKLRTY